MPADRMAALADQIGAWTTQRPSPLDILIAPDSETAVSLGYQMAHAYRELAQAAIERVHGQQLEIRQLRARYHAALDELGRLRTAQRRTSA